MRCARCGNENPDGNRFCGMCGATLLTAPAPVASAPAQVTSARPPVVPVPAPSSAAQPQPPVTPRTSTPVSEEPVISGPSFLGLNEPAPRKRASLSADHGASSNNLDYLLEDEEEPRRGGATKYVLILVALALAVGFGYLRWKNQKFGWLGAGTSKPSATAQNPDTADPSITPPASTGATTPASTPSIQPETSPAPAVSPAAGATTSNPPAATPAGTSTPDGAASTAASPKAAPASSTPATSDSPATSADSPAPANPKPSVPDDQPPAAAVKPAKPVDPVREAQKYLYGKGVPQDCERGMRLLKPAANQANPRAMIEMGALYSAGLCTPHDLPTAYSWFSKALRKDPDNEAAANDLQKLWGEMTQPERQLAMKLSH